MTERSLIVNHAERLRELADGEVGTLRLKLGLDQSLRALCTSWIDNQIKATGLRVIERRYVRGTVILDVVR